MEKKIDRVILSRPAVEAGEKLGFLPGDMKEKVDPYLRPLYDALYELFGADKIDKKIETGEIEIAPLAFMRGRTLKNCFAILDEAQNATETQIKMFLTRIGENSKLVVNGDPSQVDLINKSHSGLVKSKNILKHEMALFDEWYLLKNKEILLSEEDMKGLNKTLEIIAESNISQPFFFVHRDFHSRNLMLLNDNGLGMLDFQDARIGPITYDLVSLLKDAYIELDEEFIIDKVVRYWEMACMEGLLQKSDFSDFFQQFEIMGVQRHLKILGIFSRLSLRDGKHNYLNDIPLVEKYLLNVCERYSVLAPLRKILRRAIHEH